MSNVLKYWLFRFIGHAFALVPVICETLSVLPYCRTEGILAALKLTCSAALIISVAVFCLLKNILKERVKSPSPCLVACVSFLLTAASQVIAEKLFYITLAWAIGSLTALIPYEIAARIKRKNSHHS